MPEQAHVTFRPKVEVPAERAPAAVAYAELQVTSNFSFLRGGSHPEELVARAAEVGCRAVGITDVNTLAGVVRAHEVAKEAGGRLVVGCHVVCGTWNAESGNAKSEMRNAKRNTNHEPRTTNHEINVQRSAFSVFPVEVLLYPTDRAAY